MTLPSWISSLMQPRRRPIRNAALRPARLSVQQLEDRTVPNVTAGALTPPVSPRMSDFTVFHFSDTVPTSAVGDIIATVNTGDTTLDSARNPNNVRIVANGSGFDVRLTYAYAQNVSNQSFAVTVSENGGGSAGAGTKFSVQLAAISTTPIPELVTLGNTPATLNDTAVLVGGYHPTGTITFTLRDPHGTIVDTETAAVNGDGMYSTPAGYALPSGGTVAGLYQWNTSYSGDANNNSAAPPPAMPTLVNLASFNVSNGGHPWAGVVEDSHGNLFGTTTSGGAHGYGTVYEIGAGSRTITTLASFDYYTTGAYPTSLIADSAGNLFGTAYQGGPGYAGTVFELATGSGTLTTLASFDYFTRSSSPIGGLVEDSAGNLFGTTKIGGTYYADGAGTVFEIVAGSGTVTTLAAFDRDTTGAYPIGALVKDSAGNLFGTTSRGGPGGYGTVFEVVAGTGTITTLAPFNYSNGAFLIGGVVEDSAGNLFGTTEQAGPDRFGTVFEVVKGSGAVTTLASFNGFNGAYPTSLIADSAGNLFGTTQGDGPGGYGTVFEVAAGSGAITTLASFNYSNGADPLYGTLIQDSAGNLFGATSQGGPGGAGTVFEVKAGASPGLVVINAANPTLGAISTPTTSFAGQTLTDTADLELGYHPTGTLTFTLYDPNGLLVDTETATVSGNGHYATPTGYTLPTGGTLTGAYQWDVSYAGDSNNRPVSDIDDTAAQVAVSAVVATTTTATGGMFVYNGNQHAGSGSVNVTGGVVTFAYVGLNGTNYSSTTAPTNAGSYMVTATYAGDQNHTGSSDSATIAIAKATSSVAVAGSAFTYDGTTHTGGSAAVSGVGTGITQSAALSYAGDRVNAGTYTVIAAYAGDQNHTGSSSSARITIAPKLLAATAWSQGTINIGSNGSIVLHLAVSAGQLYGTDTVASLFNDATFTIKVEKADGSVTYGSLTSTAKVETDGSITVSMQMSNALKSDLYDAYANGRAVDFEMTATANGGNYALDANTLSRLLNNGAFKYVP